MVRTRGNCSAVRVGQKASFKASSTSPSTGKSKRGGGGGGGSGNRYCPRETPTWQKEITQFFNAEQTNCDTDSPKAGTASGITSE